MNPFRRPAPAPASRPLFELSALTPAARIANEAAIRALTHYAHLGRGRGVCRVLGRYKLFVDTDDRGLAPHLMLEGYWEMWVTEALAALVKPGMVVADIGANLGYFTLLMADLCGPDGHVFAFEPNPATAALLRDSVTLNGFAGRTTVEAAPLADHEGVAVELIVPPGEPKNACIALAIDGQPPRGERMLTRRLDAEPAWRDIDLVKIDAEGAESLIWDGMAALLSGGRLRTVIVEFTASRYADPAAFLARLTGHGFGLSRIDELTGIQRASAADILARDPDIDVMLLLRR